MASMEVLMSLGNTNVEIRAIMRRRILFKKTISFTSINFSLQIPTQASF